MSGRQDNFVGIYTRLGAGRSGIRVQAEAGSFNLLQTVHIVSEAHSTSYAMASRLTTQLHLLPRLRMSGDIPLLLPYIPMALTGEILLLFYNNSRNVGTT